MQLEYFLQEKQKHKQKCITTTVTKRKIGQNKKIEPFSNGSNQGKSVVLM